MVQYRKIGKGEIEMDGFTGLAGRREFLKGAIIVADGGITINGDLSKIDTDW